MLSEFFESIYQTSLKLEENRSKVWFTAKVEDVHGDMKRVPTTIEDEMNQLNSLAEMEKFLKSKYKNRKIKIEKDDSIGWKKVFA